METGTGKIGMGKTERRGGKGRSRKKEGREGHKEEERENNGDKESGRGMENMG